jgi:tRNA (guanine37-N1)-methyltransferase
VLRKEFLMFLFTVITIFPEMFPGPLLSGVSGKQLGKLFEVKVVNIRDFADDKRHTVDDVPYGGGAGMVMKPDVLHNAILHALSFYRKKPYVFFTSPRGRSFSQKAAKNIVNDTETEGMVILCGRYEGIDERLIQYWKKNYGMTEISIGDYVLSGGEIPALVMIDACLRLIPGVLGNSESLAEESFSMDLLEYPHYTRPAVWMEEKVPQILLSGNHEEIAAWRLNMAKQITKENRPDLWSKYCFVNCNDVQ